MATKKKPAYTITLSVGGVEYTSSNDDLTKALLGLKVEKVSNRAIFTLTHDGKKATLMKRVRWARQILTKEDMAFWFGKNLLTLLK